MLAPIYSFRDTYLFIMNAENKGDQHNSNRLEIEREGEARIWIEKKWTIWAHIDSAIEHLTLLYRCGHFFFVSLPLLFTSQRHSNAFISIRNWTKTECAVPVCAMRVESPKKRCSMCTKTSFVFVYRFDNFYFVFIRYKYDCFTQIYEPSYRLYEYNNKNVVVALPPLASPPPIASVPFDQSLSLFCCGPFTWFLCFSTRRTHTLGM